MLYGAIVLLILWSVWRDRSRDPAGAAQPVAGGLPVAIDPARLRVAGAPPPRAPRPANPLVSLDPAMARAEAAKKALDSIAAGGEAARRGEVFKAVEHYTDAIHLDPTNPSPRLARAYMYTDNRIMNWPGVIADATEAIRLDPKNAEAYKVRANAASRSGDHKRAISDATEAIRLDANRTRAYAARGSAYNGLGEWERAIADFDETLSRQPDSSWPLALRSFAYQSKGDYDRALADIDRAIDLDRGIAGFWFRRGQIRAKKKQFDRALADLSVAIRLSSAAERFAMLRERGEIENALGQFDRATPISPRRSGSTRRTPTSC
jgi:tetratricopeptide (TPR) repeat protein